MYNSIVFTNSLGETLTIGHSSVDAYRFIDGMNLSGLQTTMFTTTAYNQDGETWVNSLLQPLDFSLYFLINLKGKDDNYYLSQRRAVASIFNPKKSPSLLTFNMKDGNVYHLDCVVNVAPLYPDGFENKNNSWQVVQVQIVAPNPLFYSDGIIINNLTSVTDEFEFSATTGNVTQPPDTFNFVGKTSGSNLGNSSKAMATAGSSLLSPAMTYWEYPQTWYNNLGSQDGVRNFSSNTTANVRVQNMYAVNILEEVETTFGQDIWNGATAVADKITIAKGLITSIEGRWWGYGRVVNLNTNVHFSEWDVATSTWINTVDGVQTTDTLMSISSAGQIDASGYQWYMAYTDASDGTNEADLLIDYFETIITWNEQVPNGGMELSSTNPTEFGAVIPNPVITNDGELEAPCTIVIEGDCTNPKITNVTTGEYVRLNITMASTDVVRIDTTFGKKSVTLNGSNAFNKLDFTSTFFNLVVGDNEIDFTADNTGSAQISLEYKKQFSII